MHHSAPGIILFKCEHMPIQNRPYTPLKHQKFPHTHTHHHILSSSSFHKAPNITTIVYYIQIATHKLPVGRIQQAKDYLAFKQHARMSAFYHA